MIESFVHMWPPSQACGCRQLSWANLGTRPMSGKLRRIRLRLSLTYGEFTARFLNQGSRDEAARHLFNVGFLNLDTIVDMLCGDPRFSYLLSSHSTANLNIREI